MPTKPTKKATRKAPKKKAARKTTTSKKKATAKSTSRRAMSTTRSPEKIVKKRATKQIAGTIKTCLTPKELEAFREMLLVKRRQLAGDVDDMRVNALKQSRRDAAGDLSSMPIHMADIGSDNYEREFTLELIQNEQSVLKEIDEALQRIEDGTYGICLATGKRITKSRLKFKPWAKYSVRYARQSEKPNHNNSHT